MGHDAPIAEQPVDDVFVTAVVYLPNLSALPEPAEKSAERIRTRSDGTIAVTLGSFSIETNNSEERQMRLTYALNALWATFVNAGFGQNLDAHAEEVFLSISLSPVDGQAGIAIAHGTLRPWLDVRAQLHVNAYKA